MSRRRVRAVLCAAMLFGAAVAPLAHAQDGPPVADNIVSEADAGRMFSVFGQVPGGGSVLRSMITGIDVSTQQTFQQAVKEVVKRAESGTLRENVIIFLGQNPKIGKKSVQELQGVGATVYLMSPEGHDGPANAAAEDAGFESMTFAPGSVGGDTSQEGFMRPEDRERYANNAATSEGATSSLIDLVRDVSGDDSVGEGFNLSNEEKREQIEALEAENQERRDKIKNWGGGGGGGGGSSSGSSDDSDSSGSGSSPFDDWDSDDDDDDGGGTCSDVTPNGEFVYPTDKSTTTATSSFGPRWGTSHNGMDIGGPSGTPIYAFYDGRVVAAADQGVQGFGGWVVLDHEIDGKQIQTVYGHSDPGGVHVSVGDEVKAGKHIADIGNSGQSTGPHLHFEVIEGDRAAGGAPVDPQPWVDRAEAGEGSSNADDCEGADEDSDDEGSDDSDDGGDDDLLYDSRAHATFGGRSLPFS